MDSAERDLTKAPTPPAERPPVEVPPLYDEDPAPAELVEAAEEGVEPENFATGAFLKVLVITFVSLVVVLLVVGVWVRVWFQDEAVAQAASTQSPLLQEAEAEAARLLGGYGIVDAENGIYRIPIDRAMQLMVEEELVEETRTAPTGTE